MGDAAFVHPRIMNHDRELTRIPGAHDPSVRFADTSPAMRRGGEG